MIKKTEVKPFAERLYCDKCGEEMKFTGTVLCSHPIQYPHQCPNCGNKEVETITLPNTGGFVQEQSSDFRNRTTNQTTNQTTNK